jgi:uroporphyrinogen-III synthase
LKRDGEAGRPFEGRTVVITASRRASEQASIVSGLGGEPYVVPTVGISLPTSDDEVAPFLEALAEGVDYAVFMTATGVRAMFLAAERLGRKSAVLGALNSAATTVVARGGKPRVELVRQGIKVDASPRQEEATTKGVVALLKRRGLRGGSVAILWHGSRDHSASEELREAGAVKVSECSSYRYSRELGADEEKVLLAMGFKSKAPNESQVVGLIREISEGGRKIDAITFTSPPAARNLFAIAEEHGLEERLLSGIKEKGIVIAAVGDSTKNELGELGVKAQVVPEVAAMGAMMNALAGYLSKRGP